MNFDEQLQLAEALAQQGSLCVNAAPKGAVGYNGLWVPDEPKPEKSKWAGQFYESTPKSVGEGVANPYWEQFMNPGVGQEHKPPPSNMTTNYWILKGLTTWPVTDPSGTYAKLVRCSPGSKVTTGLEYPCDVLPLSNNASCDLPTPDSSTAALSICQSPKTMEELLQLGAYELTPPEFAPTEFAPQDLIDQAMDTLLSAAGVPVELCQATYGTSILEQHEQEEQKLIDGIAETFKKNLDAWAGKPNTDATFQEVKEAMNKVAAGVELNKLLHDLTFDMIPEPQIGPCIGHTAGIAKADFK